MTIKGVVWWVYSSFSCSKLGNNSINAGLFCIIIKWFTGRDGEGVVLKSDLLFEG